MKTLMKPTLGAMIVTMILGLGAQASAQGFIGVSFGKHGRHGGVGVGIGVPLGGYSHGRCAPVPHRHSECCKQWVPGRFETRCEQVFVPGCTRQVWVEPVYRTEYDACGRPFQVLVTCGFYQTVQDPGHYETVNRQIWIEGYWTTICGY